MMTRTMRDTAFGPFGLRFSCLWLSSGALLVPSRLERRFVSSTGEMLTRKCERQLRSLWLSTRTYHGGTAKSGAEVVSSADEMPTDYYEHQLRSRWVLW
jgi:hypothetical protein